MCVSQFPDALRMALRLNEMELATEIYTDCEDLNVKKQVTCPVFWRSLFKTALLIHLSTPSF